MNAVRFIDTNILVYAYDQGAAVKRSVALELVRSGWAARGETAISVQVLQELFVSLQKRGVGQADAMQTVRDFTEWPVIENTVDLLEAGFREQSRWKVSFWDALILAAARASGATELVSEDFSHGQNYDGIRVINPFR